MPITKSLYRSFKELDPRFRPLQVVVVMWLGFGVLTVLDPDFDRSLVPWSVLPIELPILIVLSLMLVDAILQAVRFVKSRSVR